jgi:hypothetical protein
MKWILSAALLPGLLYGQTAVITSHKVPADAAPSADPASPFWRDIKGIVITTDYSGNAVPNHRTEVRSRWTPTHLYLLYICQYEVLNLKPGPNTTAETNQLWNWDVAEAFLGSDFNDIARYKEFQVSPQGEWVDLDIDRSSQNRASGAAWNSGFQVKARIDAPNKTWYGEMKIPFSAIGGAAPAAGREIRAGLFRLQGSGAEKKFVSWQATGGRTFHAPEKFGILRLVE